jgi:nucleotide-binding universal stress UspA family protein
LIATDGSPCSDHGLRHGLSLAKEVGGAVVIVHAMTAVDAPTHGGIPAYESYRGDLDRAKAAGEYALAAARNLARQMGVDADVRLLGPGDASDLIAAAADREACDLIVMGSHGRSGLRRLVLGSVTEGVLRKTTKTLMVVRCAPA